MEKCSVTGVLKHEQALVFGIKGQRSTVYLDATARPPALLTGLLVDRRVVLGWVALDSHNGSRSWLMKDDGTGRCVGDPNGKEPLKILCHVLDDGGRFFKCVRSNSEAGRPGSRTLMFLKLAGNLERFMWAKS